MNAQSSRERLMFGLEMIAWLGYMVAIFLMSANPSPPKIFFFSNIDKLYHTLAYMVLGAIGCQLSFRVTRSLFWSVWLGGLTASIFGITDEWHQHFVPGRSASIGDIIADINGAWLGALLWGLWLGPLYRKLFR